MFFKFCVTCSKETKFSLSSQRLGSCFSSRVLRFATATTVAAVLLLAHTLYRVELTGKRLDARLRELRFA